MWSGFVPLMYVVHTDFEDDRVMEPDERLFKSIEAEDLSGVLGMPFPC